MIRYKLDIMRELKQRGYTSYRLEQEKVFNPNVIRRFRVGSPVSLATLDKLCGLLGCQIGDVVGFEQEDATDQIESPVFVPTSDPDQTPALKIRKVASRKGLKMQDIAKSTEQSPPNLSRKLAADNLTYSDIQELAAAVGCTAEVLFIDNETGDVY